MIKQIPFLILSAFLLSCDSRESFSEDLYLDQQSIDENFTLPYGKNNQFFHISELVKNVFLHLQSEAFTCDSVNLYIFESSRLVNSNKEDMSVLVVSISDRIIVVDRQTTASEFIMDVISIFREIICECDKDSEVCGSSEDEAIDEIFYEYEHELGITDDRVWYP